VKLNNKQCPYCGDDNFDKDTNNKYRCQYCGLTSKEGELQ